MDHLDGYRALTRRGGHSLDRSVSRVAYGEGARHACLHKQGKALQVPSSSQMTIAGEVLTGDNVALLVALDLLGQPACVGLSSNMDEQGGRRDGPVSAEVASSRTRYSDMLAD